MKHKFNVKGSGRVPSNNLQIKAMLLCEGFNADKKTSELFAAQNPSNAKRGGLSSGGKMRLANGLFVNAPLYHTRPTDIHAKLMERGRIGLYYTGYIRSLGGPLLTTATVLAAPKWYKEKVDGFQITQIITAHNRQLASAVFEQCALFTRGDACTFCVINYSLRKKDPRLIVKSPQLYLAALERIPTNEYDGLTLNGGLTLKPSRGPCSA